MKHFSVGALATAFLLMTGSAMADPHEEKILGILPEIQSAILQQDVIDALRTYNERHRTVSQADIDRMEATWRSEMKSSNRPLISSVVDNPIAERMREVVGKAGMEDIVIADAHGFNIAQSTFGERVWMGREPHFVKTVLSGADQILIDEVGFNEPTQSYQCRVSFAVADPDTGKPIGVITIGFNVDDL